MEEMINVDSEKLINALRIWSGWGGIAPSRDDSRLSLQLGSRDADALLPIIKKLQDDFYATDACYIAADLEEMARLAKKHFTDMHHNLNMEIADIFAWCYTFDFK